MGKLYIGNSGSTPAIVKVEEVPKTKFGASIDSFIGDVDENGNYVSPSEPVEINLAGIKSIPAKAFMYKFYETADLVLYANDVTFIGNNAFNYGFGLYQSTSSGDNLYASFDSLETIDAIAAFSYACNNRKNAVFSFNKLKKIAGDSCFQSFFKNGRVSFDRIFPSLEDLSGRYVFDSIFSLKANDIIALSKVKKISATTNKYDATFRNLYLSNTIWFFPRATDFSNYVWNGPETAYCEIHFATANREAIEACEGYDYKFGLLGATIYFDLILDIVVNGVSYTRKHTIDGYTSWEDIDGNLVYTDVMAEPVVGTVVYSDAGTTQVGTVEAVA